MKNSTVIKDIIRYEPYINYFKRFKIFNKFCTGLVYLPESFFVYKIKTVFYSDKSLYENLWSVDTRYFILIGVKENLAYFLVFAPGFYKNLNDLNNVKISPQILILNDYTLHERHISSSSNNSIMVDCIGNKYKFKLNSDLVAQNRLKY